MISTVFSSSSLSWLVGEFFVSIVAISGGVLVFRGLWIENKADKDEFFDVDDFRSSKLKKKRGWKMLMWGIALETLVAGVFAARDGWEIRQIKMNEAKNDPLNQPIGDISATVQFRVNKANFSELPLFGNPRRAADIWLMEPPELVKKFFSPGLIVANERIWDLAGGSEFPILDTDHLISLPGQNGGRTYFMQCHFDEDWAEFGLIGMKRQVKEIDRVNVLRISVKCLPHDLEILDGSVKLVINDSVIKMFQIPQQTDNRENDKVVDTYSN